MNINFFSLWQKFCVVIFSILVTVVNFNYFSKIAPVVLGILILFFFAYDVTHLQNFSQFIYILFLLLILFIGRGLYVPTAVVCIGLIFMTISYEKVIYIYRFALIFQLFVGLVLSLIGKAPLRRGNVLTLGFSNENVLGIVLVFLSFTLLVEFTEKGLNVTKSYQKWAIFLFLNLFNIIILNDYTAEIVSGVFIIGVILRKTLVKRKMIMRFIVVIIPLAMSIIAVHVGRNFPFIKVPITNTNMLIRFSTWNAYFTKYQINFFPQKVVVPLTAYDGSYTYLLTFTGWLITGLFIIGLIICNYRLLTSNRIIILIMLIAIEIGSFSENYLIAFATNFSMVMMIKGYGLHRD